MQTLLQDLRFGWRMLRRNPGFTAAALLTLALGIGANAAIFSVVNAVLLRPLPYADSDRVVRVRERGMEPGASHVAYPNYCDWAADNRCFESAAALIKEDRILSGAGEAERVPGARVSAGILSVLGWKPVLGRGFLPEEDAPGGNPVVILSDGLWKRRFGSDPDVVSRSLTLDGKPYTVVGVMPSGFRLPLVESELLVPAGPTIEGSLDAQRGMHRWEAIARLKRGVSLTQAQSEMDAIASRLAKEYPNFNTRRTFILSSLQESIVGDVRPSLLLLLGAVGLVLLIACANAANLFLARMASRRREMAVRAALGASWSRLVRQTLAESTLLACLAGAVGLGLAASGVSFLAALQPSALPSAGPIQIDWPVLGFTLLLSLLTGVLFGLAPSLHGARPNLAVSLKEGAGTFASGFQRHRFCSLLVVTEIALAMMLATGAGLLMRSFLRLTEVNPGFRAEKVLTLQVSLPEAAYADKQRRARFFEQLIDRTRNLPGVASAGAIDFLPIAGGTWQLNYWVEGEPGPRLVENVKHTAGAVVAGDYFGAMGIPLRRGRFFVAEEKRAVVIVDETMVKRCWPNQDPIGKRLEMFGTLFEVVGVVGNVKPFGLDAEPRPQIYLAHSQAFSSSLALVVRANLEPAGITAGVSEAVQSMDKDVPVYGVKTMEQVLADSVARRRFLMLLIGIFAAVAVVLAAAGIYGVLAYLVAERTHEIGIRMALGGQVTDVIRLVVGQGLKLILSGVGLGLVGAFLTTRLLSTQLYGISPFDPATFGVVSLLLSAVALLACYLPARRAAKVDPMEALRCE